jgi:hypothetical protein
MQNALFSGRAEPEPIDRVHLIDPVPDVHATMSLRLRPIQNCRSLLLLAVLIGLAALSGCTLMPLVGSAAIPPIPAGKARLWFYRVYLPSETLNMTRVSMNGVYAGYAQLGGAFYRDVQPGVYHITVESYGRDFNQRLMHERPADLNMVYKTGTQG